MSGKVLQVNSTEQDHHGTGDLRPTGKDRGSIEAAITAVKKNY